MTNFLTSTPGFRSVVFDNGRYAPSRFQTHSQAKATARAAMATLAMGVFVVGFAAACAPIIAPETAAIVDPIRHEISNDVNAISFAIASAASTVWSWL